MFSEEKVLLSTWLFLKKGDIKPKKIRGPKKDQPVPKQKKQKGYVRRALKRMEPKINENPKAAMFIRSTTASQMVLDVMKDLVRVSCLLLIAVV